MSWLSDLLTRRHSALETTAAEAEVNARSGVEAMHISDNAERAKEAASHAAAVAKVFLSERHGQP
jgi:hypothetical protein